MKNAAYRLIFTAFLLFSFIFINLSLVSCDEESTSVQKPIIQFITDAGYVASDTTIATLDTIKVGINAAFDGVDKLTNFIAIKNGERFADLGFYQESYKWELEIVKGIEDVEEWEFIIRDFNGDMSGVSLTISKKDTVIAYNPIHQFLNVQLGAQSSSSYGSFFSLSTGQSYNLQAAYNNQGIIDLVYYYDNFTDKLEEGIVASPGANIEDVIFTGDYALVSWETRNTIRFSRSKLDISIDVFDNASNDSLLIANSFYFANGGRKTKFLQPGDIYSFVREDNLAGIFKVVSTSGTADGNIVVDIKFQK
ncbi:MAG TPA: hypothetical protein P5132_02665 [Bacteroidales bacterium]|nr:hypothetical protein [Bacteroidales bacterium]